MRIAKEMVVNLTINELIRNRVRKLEDYLQGRSENKQKKNQRFCVRFIPRQRLARGQEGLFKKEVNAFNKSEVK